MASFTENKTKQTTESAIFDSDLFKSDKKTIDTVKVITKIWENRANSENISKLAELLCKFVDEKRVFTDIEFYLPQISHLIIHLDQNSRNEALELLAMVIAQTSVHAALQLSFAFSAAMEDYQPEVAGGQHNPQCNPFYFSRCARLCTDVERAVIYGGQEMTNREIDLLRNRMSVDNGTVVELGDGHAVGGDESDDDNDEVNHKELNDLKKREIAQKLAQAKPTSYDGQLSGLLYFKRTTRKSSMHSKSWKQRFFVIDHRVLICFREPHMVNPLRAISLQNCQVNIVDSVKYGNTGFEVVNTGTGAKYQLRAESPELRQKWVDFINKEINGAPQVTIVQDSALEHQSSGRSPSEKVPGFTLGRNNTPTVAMAEMTPIQRKRFAFFRQLRTFITNLTNICESLRFKDRVMRKLFLKKDMRELKIPPFSYLPLVTSGDQYKTILRALPSEGHAFTTKARVPALMIFELEKHHNADVASFLGHELERYTESEIVIPGLEVILQNPEENEPLLGEDDEDEADDSEKGPIEHKPSKFMQLSTTSSAWSPEGKGIERMEQSGVEVAMKRPSITSASDTESTTPNIVPDNVDHRDMKGVLGETFAGKAARIRASSPYGHLPGWSLGGLIAKSNDDVRQEVFVIQLITYYKKAFQDANIPVWLHSYKILSTSKSTGLIELIPDSTSIDGLKKKSDFPGNMKTWYQQSFGFRADGNHDARYIRAMDNYVASMAGYSIVAYLLAIKDRHNGNIMIDKDGHVIHIDFGFVFGLAPGKAFSMEKAPWKLNKELAEVMGGKTSDYYVEYRRRCIQALTVARRHAKEVTLLMEVMQYHSNYPAFKYNANAIRDFRSRLFLDQPDQNVPKIVDQLLSQSYSHSGTDLYDSFQLATNGIAK